jgi:hypothetical protein
MKEPANIKPYTIKELSALYWVGDKTIKRLIISFAEKVEKSLQFKVKKPQLAKMSFSKIG